jgi:hypothetical protein
VPASVGARGTRYARLAPAGAARPARPATPQRAVTLPIAPRSRDRLTMRDLPVFRHEGVDRARPAHGIADRLGFMQIVPLIGSHRQRHGDGVLEGGSSKWPGR